MYPISSYASPVQALSAIQSDADFICPTKRAALDVSAQNLDTYRYVFAHKPGFSVGSCLGVSQFHQVNTNRYFRFHIHSNYHSFGQISQN